MSLATMTMPRAARTGRRADTTNRKRTMKKEMVAYLLLKGYRPDEIAEFLDISPRAVYGYQAEAREVLAR